FLRSKIERLLIAALSPSPVRTACLTHSSLITGSMPGIAASTKLTLELAGRPNSVDDPENNLLWEVTWACASMPMITSQSPGWPLLKLVGLGVRVSMMLKGRGSCSGLALSMAHRSAGENSPADRGLTAYGTTINCDQA